MSQLKKMINAPGKNEMPPDEVSATDEFGLDANRGLKDSILRSKFAAWFLVVVWMGVIFAFSAQAHSGEITEAYLGNFNVSVRKCAHMCEYLILFLLLRHAYLVSGVRLVRWAAVYGFLSAVLYAMTDEYHQLFVPGRTATAGDVLVDSCGAALGWIAISIVWPRLQSKIKHRQKSGPAT